MNKILQWINGFRKINYEVPLADKYHMSEKELADISYFNMVNTNLLTDNANKSNSLGLKNISFKILEFDVSRIKSNELAKCIREQWYSYNNNDTINNISFSVVKRKYYDDRNMDMKTTVFFLGIDGRIWKMRVLSRCSYNCRSSVYNTEIRKSLVAFTNDFLKIKNIQAMSVSDIHIEKLDSYEFKNIHNYETQVMNFNNTPVINSHSIA